MKCYLYVLQLLTQMAHITKIIQNIGVFRKQLWYNARKQAENLC